MSTRRGATPTRIDFHSHVIPPCLPRLEAVDPFGGWPAVVRDGDDGAILVGDRHFRSIDHRCWSPSARRDRLDADGIDVQVVSPVPITFCYDAPPVGAAVLARAQNDFLAAFVADAPGRFVALGAVPLQDTDVAIAELDRCVKQLGFAGAEIGTSVAGRELGDPVLRPFFAAAEHLGALVFVHPGPVPGANRMGGLDLVFGVGMPCETAYAGAQIVAAGVLAAHPRLRVCLAHGGGALPMLLPRVDHGWRTLPGLRDHLEHPPSFYARMLYADSLTYDPYSLALTVQRFGADHVLLGTDDPFAAAETPPGLVLSHALDIGLLDVGQCAAIAGRTAARLLGLSPDPGGAAHPIGKEAD